MTQNSIDMEVSMRCTSEKLTHRYDQWSRRFPSSRRQTGDPGPSGAVEERRQEEIEIARGMKRADVFGGGIRHHSPGKA
jgi:hypothetical protein